MSVYFYNVEPLRSRQLADSKSPQGDLMGPFALNNADVITCTLKTVDSYFHAVKVEGKIVDLNPSSKYASGYGINDANPHQFVGRDNQKATLWTAGANPVDLSVHFPDQDSEAADINNGGLVVGTAGAHAFTLQLGSNEIVHPFVPDTDWSRAAAVNNLGDVVGHAFFNIKSSSSEDWNGPAFFYHHTYGLIKMWEPGLFPEFAYDVNDSGVVVGQLGKGGSDFYYPFRFESSGGGLHVMGDGRKGGAFGVNNLGDIVGEWYSGNDLSAFLYIRDENKEVDLNTRIPPNSGWLLQSAQRINDSKLIVGWGIRKGVPQPFLLRPLDEMPPWGFDLDKANLPMLTVFILFGVIGGGGGGGYTGGGNPVPIDPGPFRRLEPAVQDALVGLAIDQLARNIRDHGSRAQVRASALTNVENAIAGLKAGIKSEAEQQAKN